MSLNIQTDYQQAINSAKENPGQMVRFEGNLPSGYSAIQNITVVGKDQIVDDIVGKTPGRIIIGHATGTGGYMVIGTEKFAGEECTRQWPPSGNSLRRSI